MGAAPDCSGGAHMDEGEGLDLASGPRCWPPGVRFHPTDEELVLYYLKRKICGRRIRPCMIGDVDVYKLDPWELPEKSVLRSGEKQWHFFSPRDRKYPNGSRTNRASKHGYWKATGKDRTIMQNSRPAGNKKTLVYYHGRAPKGERTNWVMHEYTLDEQMLMSCTTVQDSFALYKLFRKSGAGPKNGEQYGAPFKEEEWVDDDDDAQDDCLGNQINKKDTSNEHLVNQSADRALTVNLEQNTNELEVLLLQMSRELDATPGDLKFSSFAPESCPDLEGARDIVNPPTYVDTGFPHYNSVWCEQGSEMASLETAVSPSVGYALLSLETPESVPLTNCSMQAQLEGIEEFLEIKDFNDLASVALSTDDNIVTDDHIHVNNGEVDADDYFDAQMFLAEAMGPIDEISPHSYWDGSNFIEPQFETSDLTTELWTHEQVTNTQTAAQSNQIGLASSASSGLLYGSGSQWDHVGDIQGNINNAPSHSDSWFASALSAFLDSVPSSPALASENALINRALTRVSSFRAVQNQRNGDHVRRQGGQNGGFLFVSFLVGLGAIVWFLIIGVAMKVFKGFWGRFISS